MEKRMTPFVVGFLIGSAVGLLVGWNVFPQPQRVADWYQKTFKKD